MIFIVRITFSFATRSKFRIPYTGGTRCYSGGNKFCPCWVTLY